MNYIDLIILAAVALFMYTGYLRGFIRDFADLAALLGVTIASYFAYPHVSIFLTRISPLKGTIAGIIAFSIGWFILLFIYYGLMIFFYDRIPEKISKSRVNRWFGVVSSLLKVAILLWFAINMLTLFLPASQVRQDLKSSFISKILTRNNKAVNEFLDKSLGSDVAEAVDFLTVKPQSTESIPLGYTTNNVKTNQAAVQKMLKLLNAERALRGESELVLDEKLSKVGEAYCIDMFAKGYFSHNTPDGKSPFDRMDAAGIRYLIAGENLALAPSAEDAFQGLLASPGHKANMLSGDFGKVGIAAIDGGVYGIMFAQEFTN